ncbi:MAG: hypothetical protein JO099_01515 [Acidobacteriia bacterium]|nr:hypothetical protein [Terriglobia bacterium]
MGIAVRGLGDPDRLMPAVEQLARRHVHYGVLPEHYETVRAASPWTLERGLRDAFTAEVCDASPEVYHLLAAVMKNAAYACAASDAAYGPRSGTAGRFTASLQLRPGL